MAEALSFPLPAATAGYWPSECAGGPANWRLPSQETSQKVSGFELRIANAAVGRHWRAKATVRMPLPEMDSAWASRIRPAGRVKGADHGGLHALFRGPSARREVHPGLESTWAFFEYLVIDTLPRWPTRNRPSWIEDPNAGSASSRGRVKAPRGFGCGPAWSPELRIRFTRLVLASAVYFNLAEATVL